MSDTVLKIEIVTPRSTAYSADAQAVTLPGSLGPFQVLVNHAPIISSLEVGIIKVIDLDGNDVYFATEGGFAEVKNNVVSIVVESAESASEIDYEAAQQALSKIESNMALTGAKRMSEDEKKEADAAKIKMRVVEASKE